MTFFQKGFFVTSLGLLTIDIHVVIILLHLI